MTGKFIQIKWLLLALAVLTALMTGCASAPANEIQTTPESEYTETEASESNSDSVVNTDSDSVDEKEVISETDIVNDEQQVIEAVDVTLDDLTSYQLELFKVTSTSFVESVRDGAMSIDDLAPEHDLIIDTYIMMNELPQNANQLFNEWKDDVGYYEKLTAWINDTDTVSTDDIEVTQQTNKPQSSESQVKEQAKDAQERVSGTTTSSGETGYVGAVNDDGTPDTSIHRSEDVDGLSLYDTLVRGIASDYNISSDEAKVMVDKIYPLVQSGAITDREANVMLDEMAESMGYK